MKKDKRILALVLAAAMMGTTALPVWAQTPETADSSVVEVEGTLENIIAAREALAAQPATLAEDDNNIQAAQAMVERVANAVKNHTETAEKVNIKDLNLDKDLVLSTLADLNARVEGGEAISKLSCYYSRDTGLAVAIGLEYCTAQDVAAMQVKLDQLVDQANTLCQTDLEKVFYVHEWLVQNIAYDREHLSDDVQDDHNLRGALLEGTAVCDGYAKTYALTLRKLGITGVLVTSKDIGHAWNMVELDGNWYQVDCTWDDPVDGSDQLGYFMHKHLLCTTEEMNTNHNDDGDDSVAFDLENLGTQNIVNLATDDTYENTWWKDKKSAIFPCGGDWYYASGERLFWRDDLGDCDSNLAREDDSGVVAGSIALDGTLLVATDKQACEQSSWIKQYELDPASHEVTEKKKESLQSIGIAAQWDGIYYAVSQQEYHQDVRQYIKTRDIPVPTATPTAVPTATPTAAPTATPTATPTAAPTATPTVAPTATPTATPAATPVKPTATPTATPVKPTAAPTATPVKPTATPASGYTGWKTVNGKDYWYENGVKQGTTGRGKEIYDPDSDAWYWLDADQGGAKAVNKDVYQESNGGKWVRYDANGHMIKGWDTNDDGTYYFDLITGAMAKGDIVEDNLPCSFDTTTGIGCNLMWHSMDGKDYWYEAGKRQGYDPNNAAYRGKEIYDPASDAWYWLDNVQQGAKTINKDVYQESEAGDWAENADGTGKWVRYDANGHMVKGWDTNNDGTYYFDQVYGTMAKGIVTIDGNLYLFDVDTGVMQASITTSEEAMADRVIELVNQERTSRGLQPLLKHDGLMVAAAARAKELSQRYSHTRPNGSECFTILWHLGIDYGYAGENIAMGQRTPEIVMNDWMNSSGHRANILNENYDCIGVGYTMVDGYPYWVQLFTGDFDL